jgi:AraC-like DNA-binding protein/mannose-6-phosphate isomerase-like protein (cupin superfamily)
MKKLSASTADLLGFLTAQPHEVFDMAGRIDSRRYMARRFPEGLPLIISHQQYPGYRRMVGENWMHWQDYYECFIALSGRGDFRAGHDCFSFEPGDMVLVDPLKIHGVMQMEAAHTALVILFPTQLVSQPGATVDQGFLAPWDRRMTGVLPLLKASHAEAPAVHQAALALAQTWFSSPDTEDRRLALKMHFLTLLFRLRQAFARTGAADQGSVDRNQREERLRRALDHISIHAHEPLTQPAVARAAGMSTSRFREFFKTTTGWGFAQYLREIRVERAAKMLRETNESVANVAHMTGFADQSHLLRCFKAKYAAAPLCYRKKHQS